MRPSRFATDEAKILPIVDMNLSLLSLWVDRGSRKRRGLPSRRHNPPKLSFPKLEFAFHIEVH